MSIVFQDALSALNPVATVGNQIAEAPRHVLGPRTERCSGQSRRALRLVGIPDPELRYHAYPHELSGGTRQRTMIAIALSVGPGHPVVRRADDGSRRQRSRPRSCRCWADLRGERGSLSGSCSSPTTSGS